MLATHASLWGHVTLQFCIGFLRVTDKALSDTYQHKSLPVSSQIEGNPMAASTCRHLSNTGNERFEQLCSESLTCPGALAQKGGTHVPRRAVPPLPNNPSSLLSITYPCLISGTFIQQIAEFFGTKLRKKKFQQRIHIQANLSSLCFAFSSLLTEKKNDPDIFQAKINSLRLGLACEFG